MRGIAIKREEGPARAAPESREASLKGSGGFLEPIVADGEPEVLPHLRMRRTASSSKKPVKAVDRRYI